MNRQEQFILEERQRTCQVRIKPGRIVEGHSGGNVVWMTPARARLLLDQGAVEIISMPKTVPGPDEVKEGLWEIRLQGEIGGQPLAATPMVIRQCLTQTTARELMNQLNGTVGGCQVSNLTQVGPTGR